MIVSTSMIPVYPFRWELYTMSRVVGHMRHATVVNHRFKKAAKVPHPETDGVLHGSYPIMEEHNFAPPVRFLFSPQLRALPGKSPPSSHLLISFRACFSKVSGSHPSQRNIARGMLCSRVMTPGPWRWQESQQFVEMQVVLFMFLSL
jgi:hypothetical protein